jgi:PAS domain S-box-containing protein
VTVPDKKTILLVEDQAVLAMTETKALQSFGYEVVTVSSGEQAVEEAVRDRRISLVLMDIDLGSGIDGPEAARRILEKRTIPVVFLSAHSEEEYVGRVREITRYGYIIKNSGNFVLRSSIEMAFQLFEATTQAREGEERLLRAELIAGFGSWELDLDTRTAIASAGARMIYGFGQGPWHIPDIQKAPLPRYRPLLDQALRDLVERGRPYDIVFEIERPGDRSRRTIHSIAKYDAERNVVTGTIHDITERQRAIDALRASEESLSITLQSIGDAVIATDIDGRVTRMNETAERLTGWSFAEAENRPLPEVFTIVNAMSRRKVENPVARVLETGGIVGLANHTVLIGRGGEEYQIADSASPIRDGQGNVKGVILVFSDVTEKYRAVEELRASEKKFRSLVENMQVGVLLQSPLTEIVLSNPRAQELLGMSEDRLLGKTTLDADWNIVQDDGSPFPGSVHPVPRAISSRLPVRNVVMGVYRPVTKDRVWLLVDAIPLLSDDGIVEQVVCTFIDITERRHAEDEVRKLLVEKEIILREVHHRVKNNMNTMKSLLFLQSQTVKDQAIAAALQDAGGRLQSMYVLYEKLYRSSGFTELSLKDYIPALVEEIIGIFPNGGHVAVTTSIEDLRMGAKTLSTLGIIINEIITNAMKYAFADKVDGSIGISASRIGDQVQIAVRDNGIGVPESVDFANSGGFGLMLVNMLTQQLRGKVRMERGSGTTVVMDFAYSSLQ